MLYILIAHGLKLCRDDYGYPFMMPVVVNSYYVEGMTEAYEEAERLALALGAGFRIEILPLDTEADLSEIPYGACSI